MAGPRGEPAHGEVGNGVGGGTSFHYHFIPRRRGEGAFQAAMGMSTTAWLTCRWRHSVLQESGRAGRDGLPARCLLFYRCAATSRPSPTTLLTCACNMRQHHNHPLHRCRFSDALRQAAIVCVDPTWQPNLTAMMRYASAAPSAPAAAAAAGKGASGASGAGGGGGHLHQAGCRRALIHRHFAEAPSDCRGMCDNCCAAAAVGPAGAPPPRDLTQHAVAILAILRQQQVRALRVRGWGPGSTCRKLSPEGAPRAVACHNPHLGMSRIHSRTACHCRHAPASYLPLASYA